MAQPLVTVLMPVYNGERFLKDAIESVLTQTFTDFELLLINDGSSDGSGNIIAFFTDARIRLITNLQNAGLIATLNRGIDLAKGKFIARMDADDICMPQRLKKQVDFLQADSTIDFVACTTQIVDENNNPSGTWPLDHSVTSKGDIRKTLPWKNCITHPSVMGRTEVFRQFKYMPYQRHVEDYDLWLRVLNSTRNIAKIEEPLLRYRQHSSSVTNTMLRQSFAVKHFHMKKRFLAHEPLHKKVTPFALTVLASMLTDGVTAGYKNLKQRLAA